MFELMLLVPVLAAGTADSTLDRHAAPEKVRMIRPETTPAVDSERAGGNPFNYGGAEMDDFAPEAEALPDMHFAVKGIAILDNNQRAAVLEDTVSKALYLVRVNDVITLKGAGDNASLFNARVISISENEVHLEHQKRTDPVMIIR